MEWGIPSRQDPSFHLDAELSCPMHHLRPTWTPDCGQLCRLLGHGWCLWGEGDGGFLCSLFLRYNETHSVQGIILKPLPMERRKRQLNAKKDQVFTVALSISFMESGQVKSMSSKSRWSLKTPPSSPGWERHVQPCMQWLQKETQEGRQVSGRLEAGHPCCLWSCKLSQGPHLEQHNENSPIARGLGKNQRDKAWQPTAEYTALPSPVTLLVFTSVCYSLSEQKNPGGPAKPPSITPLSLLHFADTCKPCQVLTVRRGVGDVNP